MRKKTTMTEVPDSLQMVIAAVRERAAVVEAAALRIERVAATPTGDEHAEDGHAEAAAEDRAVVTTWLSDVARIAAISCDQLDPLSKELGARLEAHTTKLEEHLNTPGSQQRSPSGPSVVDGHP
ncbi:hypothetical protein OG218_01210 [Kineococcus sp. NBC_00420]|uniref:hypothetical protein n=1 Tax=Kineococcus sp. NBC_00420 TaxID=2903564 RepID=UPI002E22270D